MPESAKLPHEPSTPNLIAVGAAFGTIVVGIGLSLAGGAWVLASSGTPSNAPNNARMPAIEGPVQDTGSPDTLATYRRAQAERLNGYGRDPSTGTIHIPIERAMQLLSQGKTK